MALTFPLPLADFMEDLAVVSTTFELSEAVETSETGGGEILRSSYGPRLWGGTITLNTRYHADAERLLARVRRLFAADASFLVFPPHMRRLLVAPGTINAQRNNREMRVAGLEAGQQILQGEFVSFTYGTNPVRRALHQLAEDATADGAGLTGWVEVIPAIRPGASNGATVTLAKPQCKAIAIPGSLSESVHSPVTSSGCSFSWRQTLR